MKLVVWFCALPLATALQCLMCNTTEPNCDNGSCTGQLCFATVTVVTTASGDKVQLQKGCVTSNDTKPASCGLIVESDTVRSWSCTCDDGENCNKKAPATPAGSVECLKGDPEQATSSCNGTACFYSGKSLGCTGDSIFADIQMFGLESTENDICATIAGVEQCFCRKDRCNANKPTVKYDKSSLVRCIQCSGKAKCTECTGNACRSMTYASEPEKNERSCLTSTAEIDLSCKTVAYPTGEVTHCICGQNLCNADKTVPVTAGADAVFRDVPLPLNDTDIIADTIGIRASGISESENSMATTKVWDFQENSAGGSGAYARDGRRLAPKKAGVAVAAASETTKVWDFQDEKLVTQAARLEKVSRPLAVSTNPKLDLKHVTTASQNTRVNLAVTSAPKGKSRPQNTEKRPKEANPINNLVTTPDSVTSPNIPVNAATKPPNTALLERVSSETGKPQKLEIKIHGPSADPSGTRQPKPPAPKPVSGSVLGVTVGIAVESAITGKPNKPEKPIGPPGGSKAPAAVPMEGVTRRSLARLISSPEPMQRREETTIPTQLIPRKVPTLPVQHGATKPVPGGVEATTAETVPLQKDTANNTKTRKKQQSNFHITLTGKKGEVLRKTIEIPSKNGKPPIKVKIEITSIAQLSYHIIRIRTRLRIAPLYLTVLNLRTDFIYIYALSKNCHIRM